jgi:Peptidase_C39 like family
MKYFLTTLLLVLSSIGSSTLYEHFPDPGETSAIWEETETAPFDELILTWNGLRPSAGGHFFFVSIRQNGEWSPLLYYAQWGAWGQTLFRDAPDDSFATANRGVVSPKSGPADGFIVFVDSVHPIASLSVFTNDPANVSSGKGPLSPIFLKNPDKQSLITLREPRYSDLYLTTAVSIAVNTLYQEKKINPAAFAAQSYDQEFDAYDHWNLCAAEAYAALEGKYLVQIQRLPDFSALCSYLYQGCPVVVGIKGTLKGGPRPHYREHALCVIGYDPAPEKVHCIDPYFPVDKATAVSYSLADFMEAWGKRKNIACTFKELK